MDDSLTNIIRAILDEPESVNPAELTSNLNVDESQKQELTSVLAELSSKMVRLHRMQRVFDTLLDNLPGMVYRCLNEKDWPMLRIFGKVEQLTGYSAEDFMQDNGISYGNLIDQEYAGKVWETVQKSINTRDQFKIIYRINRKDGNKSWVWEQGTPIFENNQLAYIEGYITDISEQVKLEQELLENKKALDLLNESIVDRELMMVHLKEELKEIRQKLN